MPFSPEPPETGRRRKPHTLHWHTGISSCTYWALVDRLFPGLLAWILVPWGMLTVTAFDTAVLRAGVWASALCVSRARELDLPGPLYLHRPKPCLISLQHQLQSGRFSHLCVQ